MQDSLGDRIKSKYEDIFRQILPQRTYGIVRIDGKAFHSYTKGLPRPHCQELVDAMNAAATALCKEMMGCRLAYGQSDEFSFLFTDFEHHNTEMWFGGNLQKIVSVASSIFTARFNEAWAKIVIGTDLEHLSGKIATFDARAFVIPNRTDVINYFVWRQQDAKRNSLSMLASVHFSHRALHGKSSKDKHQMLLTKDIDWNKHTPVFRHGRVIKKVENNQEVSYIHRLTGETRTEWKLCTSWEVDTQIPVFTEEQAYLENLVPVYS